jgi:hypothetical protein
LQFSADAGEPTARREGRDGSIGSGTRQWRGQLRQFVPFAPRFNQAPSDVAADLEGLAYGSALDNKTLEVIGSSEAQTFG